MRALGAAVILLRVNDALPVNPLEVGLIWEWEPGPTEQQLADELRRSTDAYLRAIVERYELPDDTQIIVLDGASGERIPEYARLAGIDLIAMSTHGRSGLRRWLYGSVTTRVMRASEGAMLIVRPATAELR